jgi:endoglycosylceramidase
MKKQRIKIKKIIFFSYLLATVLGMSFLVSCVKDEPLERVLPTTITVQGDKFTDDQGREIILNGINIVSKDKAEGYIFQSGPELYENLQNGASIASDL